MALLKEKRLPFGISCCYTGKNCEMIGSEEYFDQMIDWGAKFCWFFTYMPVGKAAVPELMGSAGQRKFMYGQVRKFRRSLHRPGKPEEVRDLSAKCKTPAEHWVPWQMTCGNAPDTAPDAKSRGNLRVRQNRTCQRKQTWL